MLAPPFRLDEALVGASTHAIAEPLGQFLIIRRCPAAVYLEPLVGVSDRLARIDRCTLRTVRRNHPHRPSKPGY